MAAAANSRRRTGTRRRSPAPGVQPKAATTLEKEPLAAAAAANGTRAADAHEVLPRPIAAPLASAAFRAALAVDMKAEGGEPLEGTVATYCEHITEAVLGRPGIPREELFQALSPILQGSDWDVARIERAISTVWEAAKKVAARSIAAGEPVQSLLPATRQILHKAREVLADCNARELALEEERSKLREERRQRRSRRKVLNAREQERAASTKDKINSDDEGCSKSTASDTSHSEVHAAVASTNSASPQHAPAAQGDAESNASSNAAGMPVGLRGVVAESHSAAAQEDIDSTSDTCTGTKLVNENVLEDMQRQGTEDSIADGQEESKGKEGVLDSPADAVASGGPDTEEDDLEEDDLEENDVEEEEPVGNLTEEFSKKRVRNRGLKWTVKSYNGGVETIWNVRENSTGQLSSMRIISRTDVAEASEVTSSLRGRSAGRTRRIDEHSANRSAHISTTTLSYSEGISDSEVTEEDVSRPKASPRTSKGSAFQAGDCSTVPEEFSEAGATAASPAASPAAPGPSALPSACSADFETLPGLTHIHRLRSNSPSMLPRPPPRGVFADPIPSPRSPLSGSDFSRHSSPCLTAVSDPGASRAPGTGLRKASSCPSSSSSSGLFGLQSSGAGMSSPSTAPPPGLERPPHNLDLQSLARARTHSEHRDGPSVFSREVSMESFSAGSPSPENQGNFWPSTPDWMSDNPVGFGPAGCFSLPPPYSAPREPANCKAADITPAAALGTEPGRPNTASTDVGARIGPGGGTSVRLSAEQAPQIVYIPACLPHRCEHCGKECTGGLGSLPPQLLSQIGSFPGAPQAPLNLWRPPEPGQASAGGGGCMPCSPLVDIRSLHATQVQGSAESGVHIPSQL